MHRQWMRGGDRKAGGPSAGVELHAECPICMENLSGEDLCALTTCGHVFHFACLKMWLDTQQRDVLAPSCPNCKKTCHPQNMLRLYVATNAGHTSDEMKKLSHLNSVAHKIKELETNLESMTSQVDNLVNEVSEKEELIRHLKTELRVRELEVSVAHSEADQLIEKLRQLELWKYRSLGMLDDDPPAPQILHPPHRRHTVSHEKPSLQRQGISAESESNTSEFPSFHQLICMAFPILSMSSRSRHLQ